MIKQLQLILILLTFCQTISAQDELMELIDEPEEQTYTTSIFHGSRLILGHSVKTHHKNTLEVLITHRFGRINLGAHELYGLDVSNIRLGLEYGLTDNINFGIGRSSFDKTYDGFFKYRFLRQSNNGFPFAAVFFSSVAIRTTPRKEEDPTITFKDRLAGTYQFLLARRFNSRLSVQLMPTLVHRNYVEAFEKNTSFVLGIGGKFNLTKSLALNTEYFYRVDPPEGSPYTNSFSIGFDIETGGHVFQLHFTNSQMTTERAFIIETSDDFFDGDIHFGFNISRIFQLGGKGKDGW